jgi:MFS family permease
MQATTDKNPMLRVMSLRDFRLLFGGAATSLLGDAFAFIAMPWLVLQLTGDPLALGIVLALGGFPRAVFMLVGGAITDRLSPRLIMIVSDSIRFLLTALMAFAVFTGSVQMWMLYAFSLGFGLVAGFAVPAENSIVPMLVSPDDLQAGNSLMQSVAQLMGFVGPSLAGVVIGGYAHSLFGIGLAFGLDAFSFAVSAACLWLIRGAAMHQQARDSRADSGIWTSIAEGLKFLWEDRGLRLMFTLMLAMNFLLVGPLLVGIPVLADQRLPEGAFAFGLLISAYSGGNLVGGLAAGALPRPSGSMIRVILIGLSLGFGLVIGSLAFVPSTWVDFVTLLLLGIGNGYFGILFTWIQMRTPREMLGRMMSIVTFAGVGLVPISQAVSGAVSKWNLNLLFVASGALTLLVAVWAAFQPALKSLSENLVSRPLAHGPDSAAP